MTSTNGPDPSAEYRELMVSVIKLGVLGAVVELLGLVVLAWRHEASALTGVGVGLTFILGSMCLLCYRIGLHIGKQEGSEPRDNRRATRDATSTSV